MRRRALVAQVADERPHGLRQTLGAETGERLEPRGVHQPGRVDRGRCDDPDLGVDAQLIEDQCGQVDEVEAPGTGVVGPGRQVRRQDVRQVSEGQERAPDVGDRERQTGERPARQPGHDPVLPRAEEVGHPEDRESIGGYDVGHHQLLGPLGERVDPAPPGVTVGEAAAEPFQTPRRAGSLRQRQHLGVPGAQRTVVHREVGDGALVLGTRRVAVDLHRRHQRDAASRQHRQEARGRHGVVEDELPAADRARVAVSGQQRDRTGGTGARATARSSVSRSAGTTVTPMRAGAQDPNRSTETTSRPLAQQRSTTADPRNPAPPTTVSGATRPPVVAPRRTPVSGCGISER